MLAKQGIIPALNDVFGPAGQVFLDQAPLDEAYAIRVEPRDLIETHDREIAMLEREIHRWLRDDTGYHAIQGIHGVGRTMGWHLRGRDRRYLPLPHRPSPVLLGRADAQAHRE